MMSVTKLWRRYPEGPSRAKQLNNLCPTILWAIYRGRGLHLEPLPHYFDRAPLKFYGPYNSMGDPD